jgi:hypothetical protein
LLDGPTGILEADGLHVHCGRNLDRVFWAVLNGLTRNELCFSNETIAAAERR